MSRLADRWTDVSLRAKITGVTVFILFLGLIVAGVGTMALLRPTLINQQTTELEQLRSDPSPALAPNADLGRLTANDVLFANREYYVAILDADGTLIRDNRFVGANEATERALPELPAQPLTLDVVAEHQRSGDFITLRSPSGTEWRAILLEIRDNNVPSGSLLIASSTSYITQTIANYVVIFTAFGIAVILLGAALTRLLVTATMLPLAEVEKTALEISRGDYSKRIMVTSPHTEVGHLGESLNVMLDRLDGSLEDRARTIERMRRFIGDASHELRTPLVSVRGYAELYRMGALQDQEQIAQAMERIEKESIRMTSLVEDLLALARLDERRPLELAPLPLNRLAHDAALDARAQAPEREVTVVEDPSGPEVVGDEHKVRQLMTNLIGNAMRHTPAGSPIEIVVSAGTAQPEGAPGSSETPHGPAETPRPGGTSGATTRPVPPETPMARFDIVDHGEGVPEQIRDKIFGRFWRADTSRNRETGGSGLGLAIVKSIVDAHGGRVSVHETPGGGATFRVELPAAGPTDDTVPVPRLRP
ncbi:sensor histidine kinase [Leucobacter massiliensis]|uniref:histidine kinase n=1 Tax=Leucobacter massiliensis TaxID=1686285 RepID=A0A2S9QL14_9MICO|nr:HAMP domain-containing sensor histidine kinase [Leucobacter massiliensis]PRI10272.1 two-component sensor histidine kinase [Leucobacter massiliensis]